MATVVVKRSGKKKKHKETAPPTNTKMIKRIESKIREMDSDAFHHYLNSNVSIFDS